MEEKRVFAASSWIIVIFLGAVLLRLAKPVLFPFFLAMFFYFVLSPALDFFSRLKIPRTISIIFIIVVTFLLLYLLGVFFYSSGKAFAVELPKYERKMGLLIDSLRERLSLAGVEWDPLVWAKTLKLEKIASVIISSLGPFFSFLFNLLLIFVFLLFMLAGRGKIKSKVEKSFDTERSVKIISVIENIDSQIQKHLAIRTIASIITGLLATGVMLIFGIDFAVVFGFLTFLLNYIPNIGSFFATAFPVLIAVFQFDSLWPAFWILLILIVVQASVANLLEPKLMGQGLGMSPLLILFSLFFWGWLWGIPGMILAVPILAVIKIICSNIPSLQFIAVLMSK